MVWPGALTAGGRGVRDRDSRNSLVAQIIVPKQTLPVLKGVCVVAVVTSHAQGPITYAAAPCCRVCCSSIPCSGAGDVHCSPSCHNCCGPRPCSGSSEVCGSSCCRTCCRPTPRTGACDVRCSSEWHIYRSSRTRSRPVGWQQWCHDAQSADLFRCMVVRAVQPRVASLT